MPRPRPRPRRSRGPYKPADQRKQGYFTRLAPELIARMRDLKERRSVPEAQQIDQALRRYLDEMDTQGQREVMTARLRAARTKRHQQKPQKKTSGGK